MFSTGGVCCLFFEEEEENSHDNQLFWKSKESHASRESDSEDTQKLAKFFSETKGEIYLSEATCITYTMDIGRYIPLDFTDDFKSILKGIIPSSLCAGIKGRLTNLYSDQKFNFKYGLTSDLFRLNEVALSFTEA